MRTNALEMTDRARTNARAARTNANLDNIMLTNARAGAAPPILKTPCAQTHGPGATTPIYDNLKRIGACARRYKANLD
jgi:hypothetical protein